MPKKISLRAPGRPPAPTSAFGVARPKRPSVARIPRPNAGAGLGAPPGAGVSPMQGVSLSQPTAAFKSGGSVHGHKRMAHHHDDHRLHRGRSEHGHSSFHEMPHSGVKDEGSEAHAFVNKHGGEVHEHNSHTGHKHSHKMGGVN